MKRDSLDFHAAKIGLKIALVNKYYYLFFSDLYIFWEDRQKQGKFAARTLPISGTGGAGKQNNKGIKTDGEQLKNAAVLPRHVI